MHRVLCFGEILWDLLPAGRFLGGAPFNVAYHLVRNGCAAQLVSAVGRDALGEEARARAAANGVVPGTISLHPSLPTGTAVVQLDASGQAWFEIRQPVAWDEIPVDEVLAQPPPAALVFGTLALRSPANRAALTRLLDAFPQVWVVCDINLRPPFDDLAPVAPLLGRCHLLKLNGDEARRLCARASDAGDWREMSAELARRHHGAIICITRGAEGACVLDGAIWAEVDAPRMTVRDTVGAGDAFTAALLAGWLRAAGTQPHWPRILCMSCALGGFVASRDGAQPDYGEYKPVW